MAAAEAEGYSSSSRRLPVSSFSVSSSEEMNHPHQNPINMKFNESNENVRKQTNLITHPAV
jgi:hypothetical protein